MGDLPAAHVVGHEHADVTGGWLRPAVFGAMDGLVSNAALIAGVAGGTRSADGASAVVLAGLAGLAAGAFSMAAGEYASVASQAEAAEFEVAKERREIIENPGAEQAELAAMLADRGLEESLAKEVAAQVHRDVDTAVAVHSMEEFGINPSELSSPYVAAGSSFVAFAVGALVPVLPFLFGVTSLWPAMVATLVALFICGAVVTRVTSRQWWFGGGRQVALGGVAFAVTYLVGMGVGGAVG
ncbi:VIT1/CCC1 family predicted Fe2+/Mn2+ transporter [Nocardioides daedukensis]|uniref:VIT1/CCC1 family predicted Fe2+/Mn2+ transporter n=1 Tax=Nocardioides daedukensis TaxID=634462 RepID=A0A7Y9RZ17_9ACTN|nr:VIT1/CCC1 transporter family protein [Nocardioides daedukensis]NYG57934.1 VIT1/CCC1 family predicted Fe2+/Mn2+ transporter [Nocardioides daedukensis]